MAAITGSLMARLYDEEARSERVDDPVQEPQRQGPRRRVPHRGQRVEADVMERRAEVLPHVRVLAGAHEVAGAHEDARVVGVPESERQRELQDDAEQQDAPVGRGERPPGARRPRAAGRGGVIPV